MSPAKDIPIVHDYIFQSRFLDELTGRIGNVATDALTGVSLFSGTDQFLPNMIPGAGGALLGPCVVEKISGYNATLFRQAAAGELLRKRVATLSVFEKLLEASTPYMQQSISFPGMNILYFLSFKVNILIIPIAVGIKIVLTPFMCHRDKIRRRYEACNTIKKVFEKDVIDVDFILR